MIVCLTGILNTEKVSIDRIEPSWIQMGVTYHMDIHDIVAQFRTVLLGKKKNIRHPSSVSRRSLLYKHSCRSLVTRRFPPGVRVQFWEGSDPCVE